MAVPHVGRPSCTRNLFVNDEEFSYNNDTKYEPQQIN